MDEYLHQESTIPAMKVRKSDPVYTRTNLIEPAQPTRSFEQLFLENWNPIYRVLLRITGDPAEAEDLAMDTFIRFHQNPPKTGEGYNPGGWLFRVATNLGLRSIRSYKRREHYELAAGKNAWETAQEDRPAEIIESKENNRLARVVLANMNPRRAALLVLRYSGMSYKDIASAMQLSPTSIGPLLLRAEHEFEKAYRALNQEEV
jgi:RNA polymerase sigma factor (sigma-70 family)